MGWIKEQEGLYEALKAKLIIDPLDLDFAIIKQPDLYADVGEAFAKAESIRDQAKSCLEEESAELDAEIRSNTTNKLTESQVANAIKLETSYKDALDQYLIAKEIAGRWKALLESFSQRSYMLNHLVSLHISGYWGQDVNPREALAQERRKRAGN